MVLDKIKHFLGLLLTIYGTAEPSHICDCFNKLGYTSQTMRLINPIYFRRQSVTNPISGTYILDNCQYTQDYFTTIVHVNPIKICIISF